ncbi:MAG: SIR2 family protein [Saprospiraceae bacterium]|nr:SIR2 family protein [Saprospiraceae bacterium]
MNKTEAINWDFILEKIREESAVLILGPEILTTSDGQPAHRELIRLLDPPNNEKILRYYERDGFFLFDEGQKRTLLCHDIKRFYNSLPANKMLEQLLDIPFHIILNVNPDRVLQKAFDKKGYSYEELFYKRDRPNTEYKQPTANRPLIYNIFGSVESEESMILTHDDLFEYFKSIFAGKSMPNALKLKLLEAKNFIFLGLEFDHWYMQLLLREFEIHKQQYSFTRYAANQGSNPEMEVFCTEQFKINFISDNLSQFVGKLHQEAVKADLIRKEEESFDSEIQKIKISIRDGDLEEALDLFQEMAEQTAFEDDATIIAGRYRKFQLRARRGALTEDDRMAKEAELSEDLLAMLKQM